LWQPTTRHAGEPAVVGFYLSETDTQLTYMIDIVLTTEFSLATASVR